MEFWGLFRGVYKCKMIDRWVFCWWLLVSCWLVAVSGKKKLDILMVKIKLSPKELDAPNQLQVVHDTIGPLSDP